MAQSSELSPRLVYGNSSPLELPLHSSEGRRRALNSKKKTSAGNYFFKYFRTQNQAFACCDHIDNSLLSLQPWAFEIDDKGRRAFAAASYESFWRWYSPRLRRCAALHVYEIIRQGTASKLYFDLEYRRHLNENANPTEMVQALKDAVRKRCKEMHVLFHDDSIVELDSSTELKWSKHLIFDKVVFHDNIQAGYFARDVVSDIAMANPNLLMVRNSDGIQVPFVDLAVYTRNRCFRLALSCKVGKHQRLHLVGTESCPRWKMGKPLFMKSLICNVSAEDRVLGSPQPLDRQPSLSSQSSLASNASQGSDSNSSRAWSSPFRKIDDYVLDLVQPRNGGIYGATYFPGSSTVRYAIKGGYKYCERIKRHHKSNNVILVAEVAEKLMHQRCFDPDCRDYRSPPWKLPDSLFGPNPQVDGPGDEVSDGVLMDMMDEFEDNAHGPPHPTSTESLSDAVLSDLMDEFEGRAHVPPRPTPTESLSDAVLNDLMDKFEEDLEAQVSKS